MSSFLNSLRRDQRGISAVEFALFLPVLLLMFAGFLNVAMLLSQANAVEKGLRSGALYAARADYPLTAAAQTAVENLVKTGSANGTAGYLAPGWQDAGASLNIQFSDYDLDGEAVPVVRLSATVPFEPILESIFIHVGFGDAVIELSHEQARIGL
jgi:hypothetical protein